MASGRKKQQAKKTYCPQCKAEVLTTEVRGITKDSNPCVNLYCAGCGFRGILIPNDELLNTPAVDVDGEINV